MIAVADCMRLAGHSVVICKCRTADGFLPCPSEARLKDTAVYPPAAYARAQEELDRERAETPVLAVVVDNTQTAYAGGYTGSICDVCGSPRMRRSGTCETCDDCGAAGGCG